MFEQAKTLLSTSSNAWRIFFRRLENYAAVPPTPEMMDMIGKIMVEVLSILAIATKEIKQGRTSELFISKYITIN